MEFSDHEIWGCVHLTQTRHAQRTCAEREIEMKLSKLGICGIISLLSYTAMVVFSPLAYPGYDWMTMAVSDLSAEGAPSAALAGQLNALFGPCAVVSIMAVCVAAAGLTSRLLRIGIYCFAVMEWLCNVGYKIGRAHV